MFTARDYLIIDAVSRYYVLNSRQIQRLLFADDESGRVTRRRLQLLHTEKLINKQQMQFAHPFSGTIGPVYYPSQKGLQVCSDHFDNDRYLKISTKPPVFHHVWHWLAVAETHMALDKAVEEEKKKAIENNIDERDMLKIEGWINEYDEICDEEAPPEKKYQLYTLIRENPRLVCAPDAGFMLSIKGHSKVFYLEQDRATSGTKQIACSKAPGYTALAERMLHRRHFPTATVDSFTVLMVTTGAGRREALRKAIREKSGAHLWKFATIDDLTTDAILHNKIWYPADDGAAGALVKGEANDAH